MARIVILGAGLTGLSTAYHLEKNNFFDFKIFEKEKEYGGLVRSVKHNGFTFDFTGHFLHCNDKYFQSLLKKIFPKNSYNTIARNSFVFTHDRFVPYPIQTNLHHLPTQVMIEMLCGFAKRKHFIKNPKNFYEWVLKYFGSGLAKHFFFPYNKKLLQCDPRKIHHAWTDRFVPKINIHDLLKNITCEKTEDKDIGYNHHFIYPKKNGIQYFTDRLRNLITSPINSEHDAIAIDNKQKCVIFSNGHVEKYEKLITTIPLTNLLKISKEPTNLNVNKTRQKLLCTSVVNFNIGFKPGNFTDKHWIYTPEKKYKFYRVGFWQNFSKHMTPKNCSAFYGELAYRSYNKKNIERQTEESIKQACSLFKISNNQIVTQKILHLPHAYVIYDEWREKNLNSLHKALNIQSIYSIGRYGAWKYSSMQEAILDGKNITQEILKTKDEQTKKQFIPAIQVIEFEKEKVKRKKKKTEKIISFAKEKAQKVSRE